MLGERFDQWLRFGAVALFSILLASCGSGDGVDSIVPTEEEAASAEMRLVFSDHFGDPPASGVGAAKTIPKAALPIGNWIVDTGYGPNGDGNGNDEWQLYTNSIDNVFTENGNLVLRAQCATAPNCGKRNGEITSGKIISKDRINVRFGTVKARIKMPSGGGMWPAFWMLGTDIDERPWPDAGEIDIVEFFYYFSDNRTTHFTMHWAGPERGDGEVDGCSNPANPTIVEDEVHRCVTESKEFEEEDGFPPLTDDFHVYELDWTENRIVGKIDGIQYFNTPIDGETMEEFLKEHYLILNVAVGGTLGGPDGPWLEVSDWSDTDQTDMLIDWVEVYERVPATNSTLIAEDGANIRYNEILNSINSGGGLVEVDVTDTDVPALVGEETMSIDFNNTFTGESGSRPVEFTGAIFDFSNKDLADFDNFVFSIDSSRFPDFNDLSVEFEDRDGNKGKVRTGDYTPIAVSGNWRTYAIPFADYPGIDMRNIVGIGFFNPFDTDDNLLAGTLYFDDIRFTRSSEECVAASSIEFDSIAYNPDTNVAEISVSDPCAANSLALVEVENDTDSLFVGVNLDAAGNGNSRFGLTVDNSICPSSDREGILQLSGQLMASYYRSAIVRGGVSSAFASATIDPDAPGTTLESDKVFIIANDPDAVASNPQQVVAFGLDEDFKLSDFGSGSSFDSSIIDPAFPNPVWAISNGAGQAAVFALFEFSSGFTAPYADWSIGFKVKDLPDNQVLVKFGDADPDFSVDLDNPEFSTPIEGSNGWFEVNIPMSNFSGVAGYNYLVIKSNTSSGAPFSFLVTDIGFVEPLSQVPAECSTTDSGGAPDELVVFSDNNSNTSLPVAGYINSADFTGNNTPADPASSAASFEGDNVLEIDYQDSSSSFGGALLDFGSANLTNFDTLHFAINTAGVSGFSTVTVQMEPPGAGADGTNVSLSSYTPADTNGDWACYEIPLADFSATTFGSVSNLGFWNVRNSSGDLLFGKVYLDEIYYSASGGLGAGSNLATNGDFEAGDLSGWTPGAGSGTIEAVNDQDSGSTWAGRIFTPMGNGAALSQANLAAGTVQPNDTLDIAFDLCGTLSGASGEFRPAVLSEFGMGAGATRQDLQNFTALPSVWTRYNFQAIAGADVTGGVSLQFDAICGAVDGCEVEASIDNVSITIGGGMVPGTASGLSCGTSGGGGGSAIELPLDFELSGVDYLREVFGGGSAVVAPDPEDAGNNALQFNRPLGAEWWSGGVIDLDTAVDASTGSFTMELYSSAPLGYVELKFEQDADNNIIMSTTHGGTGWETLTFDTSSGTMTGTPNAATTVVFTPRVTGDGSHTQSADEVYYLDDIAVAGGSAIELPLDFELTGVDYLREVFGGGSAVVAPDPEDAGNNALQFNRPLGAEWWSGGVIDLDTAVDASTGSFTMELYSSAPLGYVELKFEQDAGNNIIMSTTHGGTGWETLTFDTSSGTMTGTPNAATTVVFTPRVTGDGSHMQSADEVYYLDDIAAAGGGGGGGGGAAGELALNGDFETGDYTDWEQFLNSGLQTISSDTPDMSSSSAALSGNTMVGAGGTTEIKQTERGSGSLALGDVLRIQFDVKGSFGPGGQLNVLSFTEQNVGATLNDNTTIAGGVDDWTHYDYTVTLAGDDIGRGFSLAFNAVCGAVANCVANVFIDNVSIIKQ